MFNWALTNSSGGGGGGDTAAFPRKKEIKVKDTANVSYKNPKSCTFLLVAKTN